MFFVSNLLSSSQAGSNAERTSQPCRGSAEHRLNTVKLFADSQDGNWVFSIARKRPTKTLLSLFAIESHFGKLAFYH
jgi:hypothetical protein